MWEENLSAWQLRMQYPSEARLLEDIVVADCLSSLGLFTTKFGGSKTTHFRIKLDNEFELQISPVDKGRDGYSEWFSGTSLIMNIQVRIVTAKCQNLQLEQISSFFIVTKMVGQKFTHLHITTKTLKL